MSVTRLTRAGAVSGLSSMRAASSIRVHARCSCVGWHTCGCGCSPSADNATSAILDPRGASDPFEGLTYGTFGAFISP